MPQTNCQTAAMLSVGMTHEERVSFSREEVARYCELANDRNAIHHDVAAARVRFPGACGGRSQRILERTPSGVRPGRRRGHWLDVEPSVGRCGVDRGASILCARHNHNM